MSVFADVAHAPGDPIFGVAIDYNASPRDEKYICSIGMYKTDDGKSYVFPAVSAAEDRILHKHSKDYLPMNGYQPFLNAARDLLWGPELIAQMGERIATVQSCAGTGALFMCSGVVKQNMHAPKVLLSNPMWPNYKSVFGSVGHELDFYPWIKDGLLDLDGFLASIKAAPEGCLVVMQVCAHNPTGVDPTPEQWEVILAAIEEKKHLICFDFAYIGFASGNPETDAKLVRDYAAKGKEFFVAFSFSKCMGLYGERIGAVHAVCKSKDVADNMESQFALVGRQCWSVAPQNGALIVAEILNTPELKAQWLKELQDAAHRVIAVKDQLVTLLEAKTSQSWDFLRRQKGMFCYTGLTPEQVKELGVEGVFIPGSGRLTVPALNSHNVEFIAQAIATVVNRAK